MNALTTGGWNGLKAPLLTWLAVEAAGLTTPHASPCSAWASSQWWLGSKNSVQRQAGRRCIMFHGLPTESHSVTSAIVTSPALSKEKEHRFHSSVGQRSNHTGRRTCGMGEVVVVILENIICHTLHIK